MGPMLGLPGPRDTEPQGSMAGEPGVALSPGQCSATLPLQELQQKRALRAQKAITAERGPPENPRETRAPGMRRPAQELSPTPGDTAHQALKANNAGESGSVPVEVGWAAARKEVQPLWTSPQPPVLLPVLAAPVLGIRGLGPQLT